VSHPEEPSPGRILRTLLQLRTKSRPARRQMLGKLSVTPSPRDASYFVSTRGKG
jgi:hypothetical protein